MRKPSLVILRPSGRPQLVSLKIPPGLSKYFYQKQENLHFKKIKILLPTMNNAFNIKKIYKNNDSNKSVRDTWYKWDKKSRAEINLILLMYSTFGSFNSDMIHLKKKNEFHNFITINLFLTEVVMHIIFILFPSQVKRN